uniref:VWFA domain-containing protein n=1 Tax=Panagrolaimus sp. ES5 TaxID=591445 RepID=A0AC34G0Q2_9BILA
MTKRELIALSAEIASYSNGFNFAQYGDHTVRAGIIGYATKVTTFYQLINTTNYDDFVNALFDFADQGNSVDTGGNVEGGLQQAYTLLKSQPSQRRQLIVLIAAAYSPAGFQNTGPTADVIKENGICIVVINFASSEGALSTSLQNISCQGYYYISNDSDLDLKFPYALTQLNCICPPGSFQFKEYNVAWGNYTNYADCFFGSAIATLPKFAQRSCQPGTLVSVTSQQKLDFITDHVLPYIISKQKKFTIGFHKSSDAEWNWWGYNGTEYPRGNFPQISDTPNGDDDYGYMWNHYGFNWFLQTGKDILLPYICQLRACDAEYICDQTQT